MGDLEQKFDAHAKSAGSRLFRLDARGTEATVVPGCGAKTAIMSWHSGKTNPGIRYVDFQLSKSRADTIGEGLYDAAMIRNDVHQISPDLVIIDRTSSALSGAEADRDTKKQFDDLVAQIRASAPQAEVLVLNEDSGAGLTIVGSCRTATESQQAIDHPALGGRVKNHLPANWHFTSTASDPCSIDHQLKQALALASGVDQQPEISQLRAKALVKWLTGPAKSQPVLARR